MPPATADPQTFREGVDEAYRLAEAIIEGRRGAQHWTEPLCLDAVRLWMTTYGRAPSSAEWNPRLLLRKGRMTELERWEDGDYPMAHECVRLFGRWSSMLYEAGLVPYHIEKADYQQALRAVLGARGWLEELLY